jgi:prophage maintenance system killer protein
MQEIVPYHHPFDDQFSLQFVNPDKETALNEADEYSSEYDTKVENVMLEDEIYLVYTSSGSSGVIDEMGDEVFNAISGVESPYDLIMTRIVNVFASILEQNYEEEGKRVRAFKDFEIDQMQRAIEQTEWTGSAIEVAGRLASNLILRHSLPNANHRTSIGMIQYYLHSIDPSFEMPDTAVSLFDGEFDWREWTNQSIIRSKQLSTVRRKLYF